jgi:hypothetical protein
VSAVHVDQGQFVRKAFAPVGLLVSILLHLKGGDILHGASSRSMALVALPEDAVQQTDSTEKSDMAAVQRGNRPASRHLFLGEE